MVERRAQSPDVDKLLVKLEAAIRKGVPLDIPKAAISLFEKFEKLSPDERERFLGTRIEVARGHNRSLDSQLAWAVLNELSERILERDEMPPKRLAQFSMEVQTVPIRLMQTHTTCRMLSVAILRTHSTSSGCMRKADRHGSNWPNTRETGARSALPKHCGKDAYSRSPQYTDRVEGLHSGPGPEDGCELDAYKAKPAYP